MRTSPLGKIYTDGSIIVKQGDTGNLMYIILKGEVEVLREDDGEQVILSTLKKGDIFGEMALFSGQPRSATVRSKGETGPCRRAQQPGCFTNETGDDQEGTRPFL